MPEKFPTRFWGADREKMAELCPIQVYLESDEEHSACVAFFDSAEEREKFYESCQNLQWPVCHKVDGPTSCLKTLAHITLEAPDGRVFDFTGNFGFGYPPHSALFMWEDGNYSCDCNRSLYIQEECDPDFPELECGDTIKMTRFVTDFVDRSDLREYEP